MSETKTFPFVIFFTALTICMMVIVGNTLLKSQSRQAQAFREIDDLSERVRELEFQLVPEDRKTQPPVEEGESKTSSLDHIWSEMSLDTFMQKRGDAENREDIVSAWNENIRKGIYCDYLRRLTLAIRIAENGGPGREWGMLSKTGKYNTYRKQVGACAYQLQIEMDRFLEGNTGFGFFEDYLASRYCPVGADNDPTGLNENWLRNVRKAMTQLSA